jgi:hypothetical protein
MATKKEVKKEVVKKEKSIKREEVSRVAIDSDHVLITYSDSSTETRVL